MKEIIELIFLCSVWNLGCEVVLSDGMALGKLRRWAEGKSGNIFKPLVYCVWCRPSIHCVVGFIAAWGIGIINEFNFSTLIEYPFVVGGTSFLSGAVWGIYKLIEIKTKYYQHKEQNEYFDLKKRKTDYKKQAIIGKP